jgi:hypothetical protein
MTVLSELEGTLEDFFEVGKDGVTIRTLRSPLVLSVEDNIGNLLNLRVKAPVHPNDALTKKFLSDIAGSLFPSSVLLSGSAIAYNLTSGTGAGDIQYTRVFLPAGVTYDRIKTFITQNGHVNNKINLGIYDQPDPDEADILVANGQPDSLLAETEAIGTDTPDNSYLEGTLTSPFTTSYSGYYWIAIRVDAPQLRFASTPTIPPNLVPVLTESPGPGDTLPSYANPTDPSVTTSILLTVLIEQ